MALKLDDIFGGHGGSQAFAQPSTAGAGDGGKARTITEFLGAITGAYEAVTGAGQPAGPAPAPAPVTAPTTVNAAPSSMPYVIGIAAVAVIAWMFFRN